ncbi:hypothetical protein AKJ09_05669 [Labilithrix luteola]|uniref:Calcineurin-like phosphoesterase domain-containing protein n=1 Tax=Labilithrix luteola TaxID=1391654 RepID=A0A0K1PZP2_9BACT|nr:metallophosphoesterase [Labilithrix luteola]AKU99005.1 hypothetical protein AKJ09_05669 [Labilithrix luteola]
MTPSRHVSRSLVRWIGILSVAVSAHATAACGSGVSSSSTNENDVATRPSPIDPNDAPPGSTDPSVADQLVEKPWEIISNKGETYLPNVFYADASQNEQIMPWTLDGHAQIDRLIYPTIGNPNLYTKSDATDQFMVVLRIEDAAFEPAGATVEPVANSALSRMIVNNNDPANGFAFLLVSRDARPVATEADRVVSSGAGTGVYRVYPQQIYVNPIPADMPEVFKQRKTIRFVFKQEAMANVPPGLYDVRFEVRRDNQLHTTPGGPKIFEYQYNAVRVFDTEPEEYSAVNITDTQVSVGSSYDAKTKTQLEEVVQFLNTTNEPAVRNASFITFNGDLHNGGSPGTLRQRPVAWTYNDEAKVIVDSLKYLPLPIFLTVGNHDGYVSTGQVPSAVSTIDSAVFDSLEKVVNEASPKAWPGFGYPAFKTYLDQTAAAGFLGGNHRDLFGGTFMRQPAKSGASTFANDWKEVPREDRNYILYDGFYQWQKTYGPLNYSWKFGKNFYVSLNSFELRQHRRSGWGMYTVNYGGGMSDVQLEWLDRELLRAKVTGDDVVLLAHHDPRGGHQNLDQGYYFDQLEYGSIYQSAINYIAQGVFNTAACQLPDWVLPRSQQESCIHDGLQEWMRADEEFDCAWDERKNGTCDKALFDPKSGGTHTLYFSGVELVNRIASNPQLRTVVLGHTHYNQLEVLQTGDHLLPNESPVSTAAAAAEFAMLEVQNPIRGFSVLGEQRGMQGVARMARGNADYDIHELGMGLLAARNARFSELLTPALAKGQRTLDASTGLGRELVVLRLVSNADLANQTYNSQSALGFGVLHFSKKSDARAYGLAQINRVSFFVNTGANKFMRAATVDVDRNRRLRAHDVDNPLEVLFDW